MNPFQQFARSYITIGLLAFMLCLSLPGMVLAAEGTIDLNTATAKQLEQLPGIGKEMAQRIVSYRKDIGAFKSVDELLRVKGIGKRKLAKVKELITIGVTTQSPSSK
ncbi:MAG: helix-hairpin-helix domain-containing protein [Nitrospirae bacterium]|nr:helix-hairpin-helix domain-containing protein [Nitrospirota bacterium]